MGCLNCDRLIDPRERIYYQDKFCLILEAEGGILAIYSWHWTPQPKHREWIELQIKILARKKWGNAWSCKFDNFEHPYWIARPLPGTPIKKRWRSYEPENKAKEVE